MSSQSAPSRLSRGRLVAGLLATGAFCAVYRGWDVLAQAMEMGDNWSAVCHVVVAALFWLIAARTLLDVINDLFWESYLRRRRGKNVPKLLRDLTAVAIWIATAVIILTEVFDTPITGFLTASSVLIAIIGLALRSMIADLFTGIALGIEQPIHADDWIELANGTVGQVVEMNWRATRIVTREEVTVVVPDNYLAANPFKNYSRPARFWRDKLQIVLDYDVTAHQAERILLSAVSQVPELINIPRPPEVRIADYTPRGPTWEIRYWVPDYASMSSIRYQVQRNVLRNLHYSGVDVPREKLEYLDLAHPMARHDPVQEDLVLLRQMHLFDGFAETELKQLRDGFRPRLCLRDEPIVRQGDPGGSLFLVKEGFLDVAIRNGAGETVVVGHQLPGMFFGEMSLLTGEPCVATVTPSVDSIVLEISKATLEPLLASRPETVRILSEILADRRIRNDAALRAQSDKTAGDQRASLVKRFQTQILGFFGLGAATRPRAIEN